MSQSVNLSDLHGLLNESQNPGDFACSGHFTDVMPGLYVKDVGAVSLPLMPTQAQQLIGLCEQAPFGRGEDTVVDTAVRNCWQLDATMYELRNPQWLKQLEEHVKEVAWQLGLNECDIVNEPYKLLIYQEGSFFVRHRDTEKMPSMFATMIIALPSEHEGGELVISHGNDSKSISFAQMDGFSSHFAAFYADCYHEVKPVKSGYRLCLVYNLAIKHRAQQPLYADALAERSEISNFIATWSRSPDSKPLMTYLLEHSYTEHNLCLDNLKNGDYTKAFNLLKAAVENDCEAYLCLVSYYRESAGDVGYHNRYKELDEDDFEEFDVIEEKISAGEFISLDGTKQSLGELLLDEQDLLAQTDLFDGPGLECTIHEATGNAGATKELWYHRGAVILWPKSRKFEVMERVGSDDIAHFLINAVQAGELEDEEKRKQLRPLVEKGIKTKDPEWACVLLAYDDIALYHLWFDSNIDNRNFTLNVAGLIKPIADKIGWDFFDQKVMTWLEQGDASEVWINALLKTNLCNEGKRYAEKWLSVVPLQKSRFADFPVSEIIQNIAVLGLKTRVEQAMELFAKETSVTFYANHYGTETIKALIEVALLDADKGILQRFVDDVLARIAQVFPKPVLPPEDWFRATQLECSCQFCIQTNDFLADPMRQKMQLNAFKKDLTHIEHEKRRVDADFDMTIERAPKKFMGTLVKNQNSYEKLKKIYDKAMVIAKALESVSDGQVNEEFASLAAKVAAT